MYVHPIKNDANTKEKGEKMNNIRKCSILFLSFFGLSSKKCLHKIHLFIELSNQIDKNEIHKHMGNLR